MLKCTKNKIIAIKDENVTPKYYVNFKCSEVINQVRNSLLLTILTRPVYFHSGTHNLDIVLAFCITHFGKHTNTIMNYQC